MLQRSEIEQQAKDLPVGAGAVLALRAAMRVLPLLAAWRMAAQPDANLPFWIWKQPQRGPYLLALFTGQSAALLALLDPATDVTLAHANIADLQDAAVAAAETAVAAAPLATGYTATLASLAAGAAHVVNAVRAAWHTAWLTGQSDAVAGADTADSAAEAVAAALSAVAACDYALQDAHPGLTGSLMQELEYDLLWLQNRQGESNQLLSLELWREQGRTQWQGLLLHFREDAMAVDDSFRVWLDWYEDRVGGNPLDRQVLRQLAVQPEEVRAAGFVAVNRYLKTLIVQTATQPLNLVRVILIGDGAVGKTALMCVLNEKPVVEGIEPMTAGIDICAWSVPNSQLKAHFWDFGGQVVAHATHPFFLRSGCVYVLVLSARIANNDTEQAEYWLQHVKAYGGDAPVLVVGNKVDQMPVNLDIGMLAEKYPNIVGYFPLSCKEAHGAYRQQFEAFRLEFIRQLQLLADTQVRLTAAQWQVLAALRNMAPHRPMITHAEFDHLADLYGVTDSGEQDRAWLLGLLDKLGIIIHFPHLPFWDTYLLNPRWLTYGVYQIMDAGRARVTGADVFNLLQHARVVDEQGMTLAYPRDKCRLILDVMVQFKLCYPVDDADNCFIIPALLSPAMPDFVFDRRAGLAWSINFASFVPRHLIAELIVAHSHAIDGELVWQYGVLLKSTESDATALVMVDYQVRQLRIWVQGGLAGSFLATLRDSTLRILSRLSMDYSESIRLPKAAMTRSMGRQALTMEEEWASFQQVLAHQRIGAKQFISASGRVYDVAAILGLYGESADQQEERGTVIHMHPAA